MKKIVTAEQAYAEIEQLANSRALPEIRDARSMEIGQGGRQGDLYIYRVAEDWPRGKKMDGRQLVPGVTQGSRHTIEGDVELYDGVKAPDFIKFRGPDGVEIEPLLGPLVVVRSSHSGECRGPHPEHAHYLLGAGTYQAVHQMDARTLDRVKD